MWKVFLSIFFINCCPKFSGIFHGIFTLGAEVFDAEVEGFSDGGSDGEMVSFSTGPSSSSTMNLP